jgi:hypothetical protein
VHNVHIYYIFYNTVTLHSSVRKLWHSHTDNTCLSGNRTKRCYMTITKAIQSQFHPPPIFTTYFCWWHYFNVIFQPLPSSSKCHYPKKSLQVLPYGRSIGSWICRTHKTYTCHTLQCCACRLYSVPCDTYMSCV